MWFYYLSLTLAVEAGTILCEAISVAVPDIRAAYQLIPGILFFNFAFSGIFVKSPTLPVGAKWLPVISLFRWVTEAQAINLFSDDSTTAALPLLDFNGYDAFMAIFGWEGGNKMYCLWIIIVNLLVYRGFVLLAMVIKTFAQRGRRQFRKGIKEEERLY